MAHTLEARPRVVDARILNEVVKRIRAEVRPRRIILFGSAVSGKLGPTSDLDLLVIMPDGTHRRRTAQQIYRALGALGVPKDVLVVTESDVKKYGNNASLVIYSALRFGKELYRAEE